MNWSILKELRLDLLRDYYLRLSSRERYIVWGVGAGLALLLLIIIFTTAMHSLTRLQEKIANDRQTLTLLDGIKKKYAEAQAEVDSLEAAIKRTPADFSLASYLESLAQSLNVQPDSMNPKNVAPNELYQETQYEVRIPKITLQVLIDYIYKIENTQGFIRVSALNIKPNYSDPAYLNVAFTVSVFTAKGATP